MKKIIAPTPPMGWNSWDCYGAAVTEDIVRKNADFMAKYLKPYGWEYIVVDIQWYEPKAGSHEYFPFTELCMDEYSRLLPAVNRFPSAAGGKGFAPLADYVHSLDLKFGIHIMRGIPRQAAHQGTAILGSDATARQVTSTNSICVWNTDMYGVNPHAKGAKEYYDSIFALYAQWGVDFIKCDDIAREMPRCEDELRLLSDCVKNCGRDIVLSLSPGPAVPEKAEIYKDTANICGESPKTSGTTGGAFEGQSDGITSRLLYRLGERGRPCGGFAVDRRDDVPQLDPCAFRGIDVADPAASRRDVHVANSRHQNPFCVEFDPKGHTAHVDLIGHGTIGPPLPPP